MKLPAAKAATDLAGAPRGEVALASFVVSPVLELGLAWHAPPAGVAPGMGPDEQANRKAARVWRRVVPYEIVPAALGLVVLALVWLRRAKPASRNPS